MESLGVLLDRHRHHLGPVLQLSLANAPVLDLGHGSELSGLDAERLAARIAALCAAAQARVAIGQWGEDRGVYRSALFAGAGEARSLHLGLDLFAPAGTAVLAPLAGVVHSVADNRGEGDYGPTVILAHTLAGRRFFTLYGHLAREVLDRLAPGRRVERGDRVGELGDPGVNGGWAPHLHLQLIADIADGEVDFPGVARPSEAAVWLERCPDPTPLLGDD